MISLFDQIYGNSQRLSSVSRALKGFFESPLNFTANFSKQRYLIFSILQRKVANVYFYKVALKLIRTVQLSKFLEKQQKNFDAGFELLRRGFENIHYLLSVLAQQITVSSTYIGFLRVMQVLFNLYTVSYFS